LKLRPLNNYVPRDYQKPILKALDSGFKHIVAIMPRRSGKDITALNYMIREMFRNPGTYFYIFPTFALAKKVIWDSITSEGKPILDYFPENLVTQKNSQEMKIKMLTHNGSTSIFQLVGTKKIDSLVGTNPRGCVFSEYAIQDPGGYIFLQPILSENKGWTIFISTPRGKNHFWDMYKMATKSRHWFCYKLTLDDTKHISSENVEMDRLTMSEDIIQQEYYTSFDRGVEGSYYSKYLDYSRENGRITSVPWDSSAKVHTAWDIGVRQNTCIIFFQLIGSAIHIIDCYSAKKMKMGIEHYAKELEKKPYDYGHHIAPHDIKVTEFGTGVTRLEKAAQLGINFTVAKKLKCEDGIEACRSLFSRLWINDKLCAPFLAALESYRQEWDQRKEIYRPTPLSDWASHYADAFRYAAVSLKVLERGTSAQELRMAYERVSSTPRRNLGQRPAGRSEGYRVFRAQ